MRATEVLGRLCLAACLVVVVGHAAGCSRSSQDEEITRSLEREHREKKPLLIAKINQGARLERHEIDNLTALLTMDRTQDEGIALLEKLIADERYADDVDQLCFGLVLLYSEKSRASTDPQERQRLLKMSADYLRRGMEASPEQAMALYKRAQFNAHMGCPRRAIADLRHAVSVAQGKDLVAFGDGVYLDRPHFVKMLQDQIGRLEELQDHCLLPESFGGSQSQ